MSALFLTERSLSRPKTRKCRLLVLSKTTIRTTNKPTLTHSHEHCQGDLINARSYFAGAGSSDTPNNTMPTYCLGKHLICLPNGVDKGASVLTLSQLQHTNPPPPPPNPHSAANRQTKQSRYETNADSLKAMQSFVAESHLPRSVSIA